MGDWLILVQISLWYMWKNFHEFKMSALFALVCLKHYWVCFKHSVCLWTLTVEHKQSISLKMAKWVKRGVGNWVLQLVTRHMPDRVAHRKEKRQTAWLIFEEQCVGLKGFGQFWLIPHCKIFMNLDLSCFDEVWIHFYRIRFISLGLLLTTTWQSEISSFFLMEEETF